jgi:adenylate cyclase
MQARMEAANQGVPRDRRIMLRIGIDLGEIVHDDADVFGQGVNVAARLEGLSEPGSVWVSAKVQDEVASRMDARFEPLGEQRLKNIAQPVNAYRVTTGDAAVARPAARAPALPSKPSIAVLPFHNMSGDTEQEYFADGIVGHHHRTFTLPWSVRDRPELQL